MNLRIFGPLVAIFVVATIGGCPVRPDALNSAGNASSDTLTASDNPTDNDAAGTSDRPAPPPPANDGSTGTDAASGGDADMTAPPDNGTTNGGSDTAGAGGGSGSSNPAPGDSDTAGSGTGGTAGSGSTGGSGGSATLGGAFGGTVPRVDQQSIDGGNSWFTFDKNATIALEFDASGKPLALLVPGFTGIPDLSFAVRDVGDEQSLSGSSISLSSYTVTVRVTRAVYTATSAEIDLEITVAGQGGSLTLTGSGTQQIRMTLNGDGTLAYNSHTRYNGTQQSGSINIQTAQIIDDQGTLDPQ